MGWQLESVEGEVNVWAKNTHCLVCRMSSELYIIWWITSFTCMVIVHMHLPTAVILCWVENSFFFKCLLIDLCEYILDCLWNWVGVSNFIRRWMHTLYYFIMFVWLYTLIHIIYTYTHFIHLYTLCRVWNFWLIFRQNKFLYIGYGFCYIFWIESNPYLYEHNIHDVMQVLQFQKKGLHLNTVEHFYIHKEAASNSHLIDEHTISPSWVFDTILNILSKQ